MTSPHYGAAVQRTSTLAILSLVLAFVFSPAGLVLGIMAKRQIRQTGEGGSGLATAGIVISAVSIALGLLALVLLVVASATLSTAP